MKVGLLGCGNIGGEIVKAVNVGKVKSSLISFFDIKREKAERLAQKIRPKPKIASDLDDFLEGVELVIEAASQKAVRDYGIKILNQGKNLMVMSVGALENKKLREKLKKISKEKKGKIYIPSGAILGLDGLEAAKTGKITSVKLTTKKNPKSLGLKKLVRKKVLYQGNAKGGIKKFPKNVNVAATLSLKGIGFDKTKVKIITDPKLKENIHEIKVKGEFGEFFIKIRNFPSPNNPKTSYLAVLSAIATLKKIEEDYGNL